MIVNSGHQAGTGTFAGIDLKPIILIVSNDGPASAIGAGWSVALAAFLSLSAQAQILPDALTSRTNGRYSKLRWFFSGQQVMTDELSLLAQYSGQRASKNLDSSEKFNLGGAYPINEGGDSKRQLLKLERRWKLPAGFTLTGFYDWGQVSVNCNPDFVAAADSNNYSLKGPLAWATLLKNRFWLTATSPF